jgi:hypothetical protein
MPSDRTLAASLMIPDSGIHCLPPLRLYRLGTEGAITPSNERDDGQLPRLGLLEELRARSGELWGTSSKLYTKSIDCFASLDRIPFLFNAT